MESAYAIIHPPQVAIVAFGRIVERPWVVDGRIEPRSVVTVSVSADHPATDGREAGLFLTAVDRALPPDMLDPIHAASVREIRLLPTIINRARRVARPPGQKFRAILTETVRGWTSRVPTKTDWKL